MRISALRLCSASRRELWKKRSELLDESIKASAAGLEFRTGHLARFADGAVVVHHGDSAVLATCVYHKTLEGGLNVDFRQSASAISRIPTNYLRRELAASDAEILASRAIDRSLRPLVPGEWSRSTQVICKPLSLDDHSDGVLLGLNAAAAALHLSSVPFRGPAAAVRLVQLDGGEIIVNPTVEERRAARLDILLTGLSNRRVLMVEMDGRQIALDDVLQVVSRGLDAVQQMCQAQDKLREAIGKPKIALPQDKSGDTTSLQKKLETLARDQLYYIYTDTSLDKIARDRAITALGDKATGAVAEGSQEKFAAAWPIYSAIAKTVLRELALEEGQRCDGRTELEVRPISAQTDLFPRLHGSAVFQRGQTQVLATVTFDSPDAAFHPDAMTALLGGQKKRSFMLHYEFPSFATNDVSSSRQVNRRELGHGHLAEKALRSVIPKDFDYTIRLACQVLESNGSSSMASACAGSLALFDAGVKLKAPVAGVAVGLVTDPGDPDNKYRLLTDILGIEDYAGDMDFKLAGTAAGFTAMQMDVKLANGLTEKQFTEALHRGKNGIAHVLGEMSRTLSQPRDAFKATVPLRETVKLGLAQRALLFRNGGYNAKAIEAETGVKVSVDDDSHIALFAPSREKLEESKRLLQKVVAENVQEEFPFGQIVMAEVVEIAERGIYVRLTKEGRPHFLDNTRLTDRPVRNAKDIGIEVGQTIAVQYLGKDESTGKVRLSRKSMTKTNLRVEKRI